MYRGDVLFILSKVNKQQTNRMQKKIISTFKNIDFKINIVTNLTEVDLLDTTFNLENQNNFDISTTHTARTKNQKMS